MSFPMFLCPSGSNDQFASATDQFYYYILDDTAWMSFFIALGIGAILALVFYMAFGGKMKLATISNWVIALVIAVAADFFVTYAVIVGTERDPYLTEEDQPFTYQHSFYKSLDVAEAELNSQCIENPDQQNDITNAKNEIAQNLPLSNQFADPTMFAFKYEMSCVLWTVIFYILVSFGVKGFTVFGKNIPCLWPSKPRN